MTDPPRADNKMAVDGAHGREYVRHARGGQLRPGDGRRFHRHRRSRVLVHPGRHAEKTRGSAQLSGRRPAALLLREAGRILPPVFVHERPRGTAVQPLGAILGLPPGQGRGRHHRLRFHQQHQRARLHPVRQCALSGAGGGPLAHAFAGYRRRLCAPAVRGEVDRQHQRHELRRHFRAGRAVAVARRGARRLLDGDGRGRARPYHLEGGCDVIMQIGTAKYGVRDGDGNLSPRTRRRNWRTRSRHSRSSCRRAPSRARAASCRRPRSRQRSRRSAAFPPAPGFDQPQPPPRYRQRERTARPDRATLRD